MDKFYINPLAILFIPEKDGLNGYETVATDWQKEEFVRINASAYEILKTIKEIPGLTLDRLSNILQKDKVKLSQFLEDMTAKNIVFKK